MYLPLCPQDPGVLSTKRVYTYYKTHGYKTDVMVRIRLARLSNIIQFGLKFKA